MCWTPLRILTYFLPNLEAGLSYLLTVFLPRIPNSSQRKILSRSQVTLFAPNAPILQSDLLTSPYQMRETCLLIPGGRCKMRRNFAVFL